MSLGKRLLVTLRDDGDGDGALVVYEKKEGVWRPVAVDVFEMNGGEISSIVGFLGADATKFGAPESLPG